LSLRMNVLFKLRSTKGHRMMMALVFRLLEVAAVLSYHKALVDIWLPTFRNGLFVLLARVKQSSSWTA